MVDDLRSICFVHDAHLLLRLGFRVLSRFRRCCDNVDVSVDRHGLGNNALEVCSEKGIVHLSHVRRVGLCCSTANIFGCSNASSGHEGQERREHLGEKDDSSPGDVELLECSSIESK